MLLEAKNVSKKFAGIVALSDVGLDVGGGEIVGLIGPNGAGKTTFFNCLLGLLKPDGGSIRFDGRDLTRVSTHKRAQLGIGRTFQRIELFAEMTPREHLLVAIRAKSGYKPNAERLTHLGRPTKDENTLVEETLELLDLRRDADRPIEALSLGRGRVVEIGRALMIEPKLLLLDEPSSGLDHNETIELAQRMREVNRERGVAILLVEHDVEMVRSLVNRVVVLDFGSVIASGPTDEVFANSTVRKAYLGDLV